MFTFASNYLRALRVLWREPAFSAHAAVILGLGIGATSAVFSLIHGVLLTPPPYLDPERLVAISPRAMEGRPTLADGRGWFLSQPHEWQESAESFESIAAYRWGSDFLFLNEGSQSVEGLSVTAEYFAVTGLRAELGRVFDHSDAAGVETLAVIIGHDIWQQRFNGDPDIVGKTIRLSLEAPRTVIGVMPPGIRFLPSPDALQGPSYNLNARIDYWLPAPHVTTGRDPRALPIWHFVAKLRDGVTASEAESELAVVTARQAEADPGLEGVTADIEPLSNVLNHDGRRILLPLFAAAALVLLISCANAAALLLVRGVRRQHEYGLRGALGAGGAALFKHVITESLSLALLGCALGVALAMGIVELLRALAANAIPRLDAVEVGWPVLFFSAGAALVVCVLAGLYPAFRVSTLDYIDALRTTGSRSTTGRGQRRLLGVVLMLQMGLTLALLVSAGLLMRTMYNLGAVPTGYNMRNVVAMSVTSGDGAWTNVDLFHGRAIERVSALPGVEGAAFVWGVPLTGSNWARTVQIEGYVPADGSDPRIELRARGVTPGYFASIGQTIEHGRDFRSTDKWARAADVNVTPMVAIVNRAFVDRYLPGSDPLGRKLVLNQGSADVIGVVSNSRTDDLTQQAAPELYLSLWQAQVFTSHLLVRARANPEAILIDVQRELRAIAPTVAVEDPKTLEQVRAESLAPRIFATELLVGFAIVASVLTLGGVYSVLSLSVVARRREIAVRSAVGAERNKIVQLVLRDGCKLLAGGIIGGIALALLTARVLSTLLYEVGPADPTTLLAASALFAAVVLLACWIPASRASHIDPSEALKSE